MEKSIGVIIWSDKLVKLYKLLWLLLKAFKSYVFITYRSKHLKAF